MKEINADNVVKVLNWITQIKDNVQSEIEPKLNKNGIYECQIQLPKIDALVVGIGKSKLESIDSATQKASKLIDEYIEKYPSEKIKNSINQYRYTLEEDDDGFLTFHLRRESIC